MFCHFLENFENSKWPPFLGRGKFFENCQEYDAQIPYGLKLSTKSLYLARLRRQKQICVLPFWGKIRKFKMAAIFGEGKIFGKLPRVHCSDTLWVETFYEIALSRTVKEIEANLCFAIFGKNSKIQNGRNFWGGENFLKIAKSTLLRYPVGRKFRRNRSILHRLGDMSTFAFFSTQNSQLLIYLINYSLIYEAIPPKSNPIQAINPMNLHTKFQKDRLNSIP